MDEKKETLTSIAGTDNVYDLPGISSDFGLDQVFSPESGPAYLVRPQNTEEIQAVVKWANRTATPLIPVSSGPPHFHRDTTAAAQGAVIVDLSRMKRIVRIDRRNRVVLIEPGVTYGELQSELAKNDMRLSMPLLPRSNKSIIASLLEREPITIPRYQWTLLEPLRCMEVIWGDGSSLRTGEAGEPGPGGATMSLEEQWKIDLVQLDPIGPGQVDYYRVLSAAQGTMGIVTWASLRCEVLPKVRKLHFIPGNNLKELIACAQKLLRVRLGDEFFILNRNNLASIIGVNSSDFEALKAKLPAWSIIIVFSGRAYLPEEKVRFQQKDAAALVQDAGLQLVSDLPGVDTNNLLEIISNPSSEPYWKQRIKGGCRDIFFLTTMDRVRNFVDKMDLSAGSDGYPSDSIGVYIQPLQQGVSCHCEFNLPFNPENEEETAVVNKLFGDASVNLLREGAFFSRPYGVWADLEYNRASQTTAMLKKVKSIFDPNGILNPGRLCFK